MKINRDELTAVLQKHIEDYRPGVTIEETGEVLSVGDGIARLSGLSNAMAGELISFPKNVVGMLLNLERDNVGAILFGETSNIKEGAQEEIEREKQKALMALQGEVADLSIQVASKMIQSALSSEAHKKLIEGALDQVKEAYGKG